MFLKRRPSPQLNNKMQNVLFQQKYHNLMTNFESDWKICLKMNLRALSHSCCLMNYLYLLLEDHVTLLAFPVPIKMYCTINKRSSVQPTKQAVLLESVALTVDFDFRFVFVDFRSVSSDSLHASGI